MCSRPCRHQQQQRPVSVAALQFRLGTAREGGGGTLEGHRTAQWAAGARTVGSVRSPSARKGQSLQACLARQRCPPASKRTSHRGGWCRRRPRALGRARTPPSTKAGTACPCCTPVCAAPRAAGARTRPCSTGTGRVEEGRRPDRPGAAACPRTMGGRQLRPKRLLIEARWVSKTLAFAGELRPRRLNN
eukprot:COSAG01_NODE_4738_length_4782_cov_14.714072_4_plen_189_part_00